ncbi:ubiquitin carboxyl-terminal hydrolase 16-like [Cucurbita pepo subsp. pepo]|uniref:ubiquitin carboxyl-terminal hydrolase 16-like n=1 Tax=Cucurbita pepo subsp. pepo TaxID=3664 RepID=UPI000C9D9081|nr:ubiquitin carboxyl-terminal hydrolase 16-like [Cucurbita pepo subsp. pepo]
MLVFGNIGLQVLLVFVVFPVICLVIRRKWRLSVARKEEINRLLVLSSEEAFRAELEATSGYTSLSFTPPGHQCAVCYSPTTTRCARCKAVRYCSGKCQIIHWRQGHKENCHPPSISNQAVASRTDFEQKVTEQDHYESCTSDSSTASFSGFSTTNISSESSDDTSTSDSSSQIEPEKFDGCMSADATPDRHEITRGIDIPDPTKPLSPMFGNLVDSVDRFPSSCKLNQLKPSFVNNGNHKDSGPAASSDFWVRTLDRKGSTTDSLDDSALPKFSGGHCRKLSSPSSFSLNSSNVSQAHRSKENNASNIVLPDASEDKKDKNSVDGEILSKYHCIPSNVCNSAPSSYQGHKKTDSFKPASNFHVLRSRSTSSVRPSNGSGGKSLDSNVSISPPLKPERSSKVVGGPINTVSKVQNQDGNFLQRKFDSECSLPSSARGTGVSLSRIQSARVDSVQATSGISSQVTCTLNSKNYLRSSMLKVVDQFRGSKLSKNNYAGTVTEIPGKLNYKGLFSYDHFVKLYNWNELELQPAGLINCGNSCYANVVLQCLAFTPPLTAYFLQGLHSKSCIKKGWCFNCEFESIILKVKEGRSPLSPIGIISHLPSIGRQLGNGKEEDAHEFLRHAIDTMQSLCCMESGVSPSGSWEEETTLVGLTFGGYLLSKIKCTRCQSRSERQERIMDLTVEIEGDIGTLDEALRKFTTTEILDGDNKYLCSRCKTYVRAKKKFKILEAPNILTVVLKRFQSGNFGKLNKPIKFPEMLDLTPFVRGTSDKSPVYKLYGVVVHLDVMNSSFSGHYVCYVKNAKNKWFKIDDSTVTPVDIDSVLTKGAYMLLYSRCLPRAPRLLRHGIVAPDSKTRAATHYPTDKRNATAKTTTTSTDQSYTKDTPAEPGSFGSIHFGHPQMRRYFEEDSSSDNSSLISSASDEGSYSTESTRDSTSADELSDYIFGDSGRVWNTW